MNNQPEIIETINEYFDGLYHSDTTRLERVFHPEAIYACATDGNFRCLTMDSYLPMVEQRPSPASRDEVRRDQIVSIDFAGVDTALARVNCAIGEKYFTDFLSLVRVDGRWRIIAKVFHESS